MDLVEVLFRLADLDDRLVRNSQVFSDDRLVFLVFAVRTHWYQEVSRMSDTKLKLVIIGAGWMGITH